MNSGKCGQQFAPVQFVDREIGNQPASRVQYLVATVDGNGDVNELTRVGYTSPWATEVGMKVETETGGSVRDVELKLEHLIPDETSIDGFAVDPNFRIDLTTNSLGSATHELRVTNPVLWTEKTQFLRVTPRLCEGGSFDAAGVCVGGLEHQFQPDIETVAAKHLLETNIDFVDTTAVVIEGYVFFGEGASLLRQDGTSSSSFPDQYFRNWKGTIDECPYLLFDRCYCPISEAEFELEFEDTETRIQLNETGYFVQSVSLGQNATLRFGGYAGHRFVVYDITADDPAEHRLVDDRGIERPHLTFENIRRNVRLAFVDAERGQLSASVVGGTAGVPFVTGQKLRVEREDCGLAIDYTTLDSLVETDYELPATELTLAVPDDVDDLLPCRDSPASNPDVVDDYVPGTPCRVETPQFISGYRSRLPCSGDDAAGSFRYLDEYFVTRGDHVRPLNYTAAFATNFSEEVVFTYAAPLCLDDVHVGPVPGSAGFKAFEGTGVRSDFGGGNGSSFQSRDEQLFLRPPRVDPATYEENATYAPFGEIVTNVTDAVFTEEDEIRASFRLVEVYPNADSALGTVCRWPWGFPDPRLSQQPSSECSNMYYSQRALTRFFERTGMLPILDKVASTPVEDHATLVSVLDGISGRDLQADVAAYDPTRVEVSLRQLDVLNQFGYDLDMVAGDPNPFAPFTQVLDVVFRRDFDGSQVFYSRDAIVLGVIPEDVPAVFAAATNPNLIFTVLRDPPGQGSFVALSEGSEIVTSMSIDGIHAGELTSSGNVDWSAGLKSDGHTELGIGVQYGKGLYDIKGDQANSVSGTQPSVSAERVSSNGYDFTFTFGTGIETSSNPALAGQPSDVIVGGGVNMRVLRAVQVKVADIDDSGDAPALIIVGTQTAEWLPEQVNTFVLSVFEIEQMIERLGAQYDIDNRGARDDDRFEGLESKASDVQNTLDAIDNWETILSRYRAQTIASDTNVAIGVALDAIMTHLHQTFVDLAEEQDAVREYTDYLGDGLRQFNGLKRDADRGIATVADALSALREFADIPGFSVTQLTGQVAGFERFAFIGPRVEAIREYIRGSSCNNNDLTSLKFGDRGRLCAIPGKLQKKVDTIDHLMGVCDQNFLDDQAFPSLATFCQKGVVGTTEPVETSMFDFLSDDSKVVTFGGAVSLAFDFGLERGDALEQETSYSGDASWSDSGKTGFHLALGRRRRLSDVMREKTKKAELLDSFSPFHYQEFDDQDHMRRLLQEDDVEELFDVDEVTTDKLVRRRAVEEDDKASPMMSSRRRSLLPGVSVEGTYSTNANAGLSVNLGRSNARSKLHTHSVSVVLSDPDPYDYFAVKILHDTVFGTPIFQTLGGQSECPGETATTKYDSFVTIEEISYRSCEARGYPFCQGLPYGTTATIGVVVQNLSPSGFVRNTERNLVYYRMFLRHSNVQEYRTGVDMCPDGVGVDGYSGGLEVVTTLGTSNGLQKPGILIELPYGQSEILLNVRANFDGFADCLAYNRVELVIMSDCEFNTDTYQYVTNLNQDTGDVTVIHPEFDLGTLDWTDETKPNFPRRYYAGTDAMSRSTFGISWQNAPTLMPTLPAPTTSAPSTSPTSSMEPTNLPTPIPTPVPSIPSDHLVSSDAGTEPCRPILPR